ncbi:MAG: YhbY family RNA-binding protein [Oscillospiraceae bacterium]|nr:YhbY family RNA-binding protein [Oscillospiraceae bacterium]
MLNSKQRAYLKGLAANIDPTFQIGKGGVNDAQVAQIDDYLRVHELIKIKVLENSMYTSREAADEIAAKIGADVVIVIGSKAVLYKPNPEKPIINLK